MPQVNGKIIRKMTSTKRHRGNPEVLKNYWRKKSSSQSSKTQESAPVTENVFLSEFVPNSPVLDVILPPKNHIKEEPNDSPASTQEEDEFDLIGKLYANKLRLLAKDQRIYAENIINDVLTEASLGNLDGNSGLTLGHERDVPKLNSELDLKPEIVEDDLMSSLLVLAQEHGVARPSHKRHSNYTQESDPSASQSPLRESAASSSSPDVLPPPRKRLREEPNDLSTSTQREDESDLIAKVYHKKLRRLEKYQRIYAEKIINDVFTEATLGNLDGNCRLTLRYEKRNLSKLSSELNLKSEIVEDEVQESSLVLEH